MATFIALILGTLTAQALGRYAFFGRDVISLLLILPLALPGIVTGIAFNIMFTSYLGGLEWTSLIVAHATFTIVVVYNNAVARLRRLAPNVEEASMDLGATRTRTYWSITFPMLRSALVAGAVLAFGLSFDEIIVTTFTAGPGIQTLPIWILTNLFRPGQGPLVAVVAAFLVHRLDRADLPGPAPVAHRPLSRHRSGGYSSTEVLPLDAGRSDRQRAQVPLGDLAHLRHTPAVLLLVEEVGGHPDAHDLVGQR